MGKRLHRNAKSTIVAMVIVLALALSTVLAYATTAPKGNGGYPGTTVCKPGYGFGDKNHCHTGPPGRP
jgi:hypothetical protein